MILYYLWRKGLLTGMDRDKRRFFFGKGENPLFLSRRWPLVRSINWIRAMYSRTYALDVVEWLSYRIELYDGRRG